MISDRILAIAPLSLYHLHIFFKRSFINMKSTWSNSVFPIAALFSFRMLGLFMLIPVFSVYATQLTHATPALIGIALGAYGLSQAVFQMPFGMLSDSVGRKPIITLGLVFFVCGSVLGAMTTSIYGMIFARILQGMGAIGSVLIALMADLTPDSERTKAMAVIGMTIGLSFSLAMVLSPPITHHFGLVGLFVLSAILAMLGLLLVHLVIPTPTKEPFHMDSEANPTLFKPVLKNRHLQRLNVGIFCQHFILTATFFAIPILLQQYMAEGHLSQQWHFYLPLMLISFLLMIPFLILSEKKQKMKPVFMSSVLVTCLCQFALAFTESSWLGFISLMFAYFVVFNILEATLPSLISRQASPETKGTAMGIYSSSQFLGLFAGGVTAGITYQYSSFQGIFFINSALALLWLAFAFYLNPQAYQLTLVLHYDNTKPVLKHLRALPGVLDVVISKEESALYLRVNKADYQPGSAETLIQKNVIL